MIGPFADAAAVIIGGVLGAGAGRFIPERVRCSMPMAFGLAAMGLGIALIVKVKILPVIILALLLGTFIGELLHLEMWVQKGALALKNAVEKIIPAKNQDAAHSEFMDKFLSIAVLYCMGSTGVLGALTEGMTGDPSLLLAKAVLDLFTTAIFAVTLGYSVIVIALPMFCIQVVLFLFAKEIMPLTTPVMRDHFAACGGLIVLAAGLRISGIKAFPVVNMLPALLLVMPVFALWTFLFT